MKRLFQILLLLFCVSVVLAEDNYTNQSVIPGFKPDMTLRLNNSKPYTRWWWFASIIKEDDIACQLDWLKKNNFGGVEIAFIYPLNRMAKDTVNYTPRLKWQSLELSKIMIYTKKYADSIGLGCDFTFGTLWPFGDSKVSREEASRIWEDTSFRQDISASWEYPLKGYVINHLDSNSFKRYASRMNNFLSGATLGNTSALFCDSWEVETKTLWTPGLDTIFKKRFGYDITKYMDSLWVKGYEDERYDYFKLISEQVINEFYKPFIQNAHNLNSLARVQVNGAPVDLLKCYGLVDIPETEAMLYEPNFSKVVASAACLSGRKIISSETFTCLYGWPRKYIGEEQTADLKLVCDALFANGTNQIYWHGTPFNPRGVDTVKFYASVHVGSKGNLSKELSTFNSYMEKVSAAMKTGKTYSDVAVYLPLEDSWVAGEYPKELQMPWSWGQYELRYINFPLELKGYHPLWVNNDFLKKGKLQNGILTIGDAAFKSLYIDVEYLDYDALNTIRQLAKQGFPICIKRIPKQPGKIKLPNFQDLLKKELFSYPNVSKVFSDINRSTPLIQGEQLPDFWCRETDNKYYIYFSYPNSQNLHYPVNYGQSYINEDIHKEIVVNAFGKRHKVSLVFKPYQSILLTIDNLGKVEFNDINFIPNTPIKK